MQEEIKERVLVIGLGEIGRPLFEILSEKFEDVQGLDKNQDVQIKLPIDVMHVCIPGDLENFSEIVLGYNEKYNPRLTIIHSTVQIGTTEKIDKNIRGYCVHSPVRGKHYQMKKDLLLYTKYIGANEIDAGEMAYKHLSKARFKTEIMTSSRITEYMKIAETTYFAVLLAHAQEVKRNCDKLDISYDKAIKIFSEIKYLPKVKILSSYIGGHCLIPNVILLKKFKKSFLTDFILKSNDKWAKENNIDKEKEKDIKTRTIIKPKEIDT